MNRVLCLFACVVAFFLCAGKVRGELRVGAAMQVITPDPLLPISGGMGPTAPATKKLGELTARAIVLERDGVRIAIVSIDALGFPSVLGDRVRKLAPRIPAENVLIGATHTHSGPDFYAFPDGKGGHTGDLDYINSVCEKAAAAINSALDNLQPAHLKSATGEAEGKIAYNYYAPDLYDRRVGVLQFLKPTGETIASLINYAVHPEVLGASQGIVSPDLIGPLCDRVEHQAGGMAIFMNGAVGGMITADNRDLDQPSDPKRGYWHDNRTWEECQRIGNTLADECLRIIADAKPQTNATLTCSAKDVRFPVDSDAMWAVVKSSPLEFPHNDADKSVSSRLNFIQLGDTQVLTIPGEALPNIGFFLKRKMRGEHNLLFGLTNDAFGYIMTEVDFNSFDRYQYISSVSLGEQTGEILIRESLDLLAESDSDGDSARGVDITPDVVYGHKDGLALTLDVYRPANPNGAAVLFMVSGGWYSKWAPPESTLPLFAPFLSKGYTMFAVRHGSSPKYSIPSAVADVTRAVRFVHKSHKRFEVEPDRLGVLGMSAGGHLSLMLGTTGDDGDKDSKDALLRESSRVAAVVALVPPTDLRVAVWEAPESLPAYRNFPALDLPMQPAAEHSPLLHVTSDDAPSLVIMGGSDELVPPRHGHWIDAAFEKQGVDHELIVYPDAGHDLGGLVNLAKVLSESTAWFDRHLGAK